MMHAELKCRRGWYYAVVRRQRGLGRAVVRSLGTQSAEEARELIKLAGVERLALAAKADALGRDLWVRMIAGRKVTVSESVDAYLGDGEARGRASNTLRAQRYALERFMRLNGLALRSIGEVETSHVSAYVNEAGVNVGLAGRKGRLKAVNCWLEWCIDRHWIVVNPARDCVVKIADLTQEQLLSKPHEPFTPGEVARLLAEIPRSSWWHGAVMLGNEYGLRIGTVIELEWGNVVANRLRVYTRKGRREVNEVLTDDIAAWLEEWRVSQPPSDLPYIFPAQMAAGQKSASEGFAALLDRIGMKGKNFSGLRKTAAARVWNQALGELGDKQAQRLGQMVAQHGYVRIQQLLGHSPGSTVTANHYMPRAAGA